VNADSLSQVERLLGMGTPPIMSMRINPGIGAGHHKHVVTGGEVTKFGVYEETALKAYELAKRAGVKKFGIQMHIGSGIMDVLFYIRAAEKLLSIARNVHQNLGVDFDFLDFGGGIGVPYRPEEKDVDLEDFFDRLMQVLKAKVEEYALGEPEFWFEPGRYLVAEAGILLTKVNSLKATAAKRFAGVDAGFNVLIRPAFYGSYHHILVANKLNESPVEEYDIAGPLCETGDILASGRSLPRLSEGDLLAILNTGAYGYSMSSQYNSRPRPAEVLVKDGSYELVRKSETLQDLLRGQEVASWLKN
jgi:diaminopimelate decarboxylase